MPKRIMILGSGGMAGHVLTLMLRERPLEYEVIDVSRSETVISPAHILDVTDTASLKLLIEQTEPNVIVNCVGILNQFAEEHPDKAILLNSYLPHFLESVTKSSQTKVIHISTDCVFSGKRGGYTETDFKDGIGFYAQSKALGEIVNSKDLTIRTSIIGPELKNGIGLFHWFMHQREKIKGYTRVYWTGVTTIELAKAIMTMIEADITGLYQLVYGSKISKYHLLYVFAKVFHPEIQIDPADTYKVDKSLINTRKDFEYHVPSYECMASEMKDWITKYQVIYTDY